MFPSRFITRLVVFHFSLLTIQMTFFSSKNGIYALSPPSTSTSSTRRRISDHRIRNHPVSVLSTDSRQRRRRQQHLRLLPIQSETSSHSPYDTSGRSKRRQQPSIVRPFQSSSVSSLSSSSSSSSSERSTVPFSWTKFITGVSHPQRPQWSRDWMPTWSVRLRPCFQLLTILLAYIFHMTVLAQHCISFPFQLIPNDRGHFQTIGWDS